MMGRRKGGAAAARETLLRAMTAGSLFWSGAARAGDAYAWVQYVAAGIEARAVTEQAECPKVAIDGRAAQMTLRAGPSEAFPVRVCAIAIPGGAREAAIADRPLRLPAARADRLLLIGDTGCRLRALALQHCNEISDWPFRLVADEAAETQPHVVLHLGDLIYREQACPASDKGCAGSPHGDNWETWKADFFDPARALLEAAPFVFARGNHEDCNRNHEGWRRFVSAFPYEAGSACNPQEPPFRLDLGGVTLAVLDVTRAEDRAVDPALAPFFKQQFAALADIKGPLWIAMHKPIYGSIRVKDGVSVGDNKTLVEAARGVLAPNIEAVLSGHLHLFEALSFKQDLPAQIVAGSGGDMLDTMPQSLLGLKVGDATVETGRGVAGAYGFALMERGEKEWRLTEYDLHDTALVRCSLRGRKLACDGE